MYFLYQIKNIISNSVYYGITNNLKQRWYGHKSACRRGIKTPLYDAMRRYGIDVFEMKVLESSEDSAYIADREIELIANTKNYNLHRGGHIGFDVRTKGPEAVIEWTNKMKVKRAGRKPALGMKHTKETKLLCASYGKLRWDIYGRYPKEVLEYSFADANRKFGISKTHYYRLRKAAAE